LGISSLSAGAMHTTFGNAWNLTNSCKPYLPWVVKMWRSLLTDTSREPCEARTGFLLPDAEPLAEKRAVPKLFSFEYWLRLVIDKRLAMVRDLGKIINSSLKTACSCCQPDKRPCLQAMCCQGEETRVYLHALFQGSTYLWSQSSCLSSVFYT
jgi:hypothetical protein